MHVSASADPWAQRGRAMKKKLWTKDFTLITTTTILSAVGGEAMSLPVSLLVFDETQSTFLSSLILVCSMLPDILLGVFTGKTQSLNIKDNLLPIASIVAGMFVRNPLLKMLLIGLGGANLLNKAGHEVLRERSEGEMNTANRGAAQYRHYPDEPLNPRITNPVLQGNMLVATIDRVPCTIQLSQTVTDAYRAGALPLNTLANAVLARSEQLRQRASDNYDNGQQETIVRTRGIQ